MNDPESKQVYTRTKLFLYAFVGLRYGLNKTSNEPYNFVVIGCKFYIIGFSICSVRSPKKIRAEKFVCLRADLLALGVIHTCEWPLKTRQTSSFMDFKECLMPMYLVC